MVRDGTGNNEGRNQTMENVGVTVRILGDQEPDTILGAFCQLLQVPQLCDIGVISPILLVVKLSVKILHLPQGLDLEGSTVRT